MRSSTYWKFRPKIKVLGDPPPPSKGNRPRANPIRKSQFLMVQLDHRQRRGLVQPQERQLRAIFSQLDDPALPRMLRQHRPVGRQGYPLSALWRAYVALFVLNPPHIKPLIRRLQKEACLRALCGFKRLPHRTTFNRFIRQFSYHASNRQDDIRQMPKSRVDRLW